MSKWRYIYYGGSGPNVAPDSDRANLGVRETRGILPIGIGSYGGPEARQFWVFGFPKPLIKLIDFGSEYEIGFGESVDLVRPYCDNHLSPA